MIKDGLVTLEKVSHFNTRHEASLVAQIGLSLAVIGPDIYGVVLFMAVATTVIAPPFLKLLYANEAAAREEIGPPDAGGIVASEDLCKIG